MMHLYSLYHSSLWSMQCSDCSQCTENIFLYKMQMLLEYTENIQTILTIFLFLGYALFSSLRWKILSLVMKTLYPRKSSFHVLRLLKQTVRQTGWSVRGFWVIISRFSRLRLENLSIITQKPLTDHPVFLTVFSKS